MDARSRAETREPRESFSRAPQDTGRQYFFPHYSALAALRVVLFIRVMCQRMVLVSCLEALSRNSSYNNYHHRQEDRQTFSIAQLVRACGC